MRKQIDPTKCSRCKEAPPSLTIRNEKFCDPCFVFFINYKFRKPLDNYKVNYASEDVPTLVVSVDLMLASMCLVKLLEETLDYQRLKHNRVGFKLECVYIGDDTDFEWTFNSPLRRISSVSSHYLLNGKPFDEPNDLSRTSKQDLAASVRKNALQKIAQGRTVLAPYTMSTLSELILSETCKGRGALIPELLNPSGAIYPLRDILDSELEIYARVMQVSYEAAPIVPRVSRLQSIDELVHEFVGSTRREFPAVDSTVARTGHKLAQSPENCKLCTNKGETLCYGCERMLEGKTKKQLILEEFEL